MAQAQVSANAILAQLAMARMDYNNAQVLLNGGYGWMGEVAAATDGDPGRALGDRTVRWEKGLAQAAVAVAQAAGRIEDLARAHDRHAADYRRARDVFRPLEDRRGGVDENPAAAVVPVGQGAEDIGGQDHAADVDRDELFDAVEDVFAAFAGGLPGELEATTADPLARLHAVLEVQDGSGPLEDLAAAGRGLADAIADYRHAPTTPADLVDAVDRLMRALPKGAPSHS
jgi:hypothetical protein